MGSNLKISITKTLSLTIINGQQLSTGKEFGLIALDGKTLYGKAWVPQDPLAMVCLIHGLGEHIDRYDHVARHLNHSGIALFGIDLRGHGHNEGKKGHARCQDLWDDIESLMKHARLLFLDVPLFLYGHSWGGNIVSNFVLRRNSSEIQGVILSSPWLKLYFEPSSAEMTLAKLMSKVFPSFTRSNGLDASYLSRDPAIGEAYQKDALVHTRISAGLFSEATVNASYALQHASSVTQPVLIFHGTDDQITSSKGSEEFAGAASNSKLKLWPDMRHETHNEYGKEEVLDLVCQWLVQTAV